MNRSLVCLLVCGWTASAMGADWPQFRGNHGSAVSEDKNLPRSWSSKENIAWKADLPGRGLAAPIIVGDRVIVTAGSGPEEARLHVLCFDVNSGKKRWERKFWSTGRTMIHPKTTIAACTPASDGKRIFALYSTNDLVALDLDGNLLWYRGLTHDYPNASNSLGMASSPTVVNDTLVVQLENDSSESFACGIDVATGENRWKIARPSSANWTSPVVFAGKQPGQEVVLLQAAPGLTAVHPSTGKTAWAYDKGCSTMPSATISDETIYIPSGGLTALRPPKSGESKPEVLWTSNRLSASTPSPVVYKGKVFAVASNGVVKCGDAKTGDLLWQLRLKGPVSSTPVACDGHLYVFNEEGLGQVVEIGDKEGKQVGTGALGETILATPAIAHGALFIRSDSHLWKIAKTTKE